MIFDHKYFYVFCGRTCSAFAKRSGHESATIVMVTHNEHDAKIAHRTIRLFDGQIVDE